MSSLSVRPSKAQYGSLTLVTIHGLAGAAVLCLAAAAWAADEADVKPGTAYPFFAFDNGTGRDERVPLEQQAQMLMELGYDGIGYSGVKRIPEMLQALDARGLKLFCIFVTACVDPEKPPYDPGLKTAVEQLKGRDTLIWLSVTGGTQSSDALDERAVTILREIADMTANVGLRVALYPHLGNYVARVEDSLRLVKKVDRKNLGTGFTLCHFLKLDSENKLESCLKEAMPHLFIVGIHGADGGDTNSMDWDRLIQPLDRGSFDVGRVLKVLRQLGFKGSIGLQCYGIPGDRRENLARSLAAWHKVAARMADEP